LSSLDGPAYEVGGGCGVAAPPSDVSGSPPVHYWKPMCVALKYDAYSLSHDYAATATTTGGGGGDLSVDDDLGSTAVTPPAAAVFSSVDRRNCFRQAGGRAARLPAAAARICRPPAASSTTHARCDEHLYEPATTHDATHDAVASSRDQHRTFVDFAD